MEASKQEHVLADLHLNILPFPPVPTRSHPLPPPPHFSIPSLPDSSLTYHGRWAEPSRPGSNRPISHRQLRQTQIKINPIDIYL